MIAFLNGLTAAFLILFLGASGYGVVVLILLGFGEVLRRESARTLNETRAAVGLPPVPAADVCVKPVTMRERLQRAGR